MKYLGKSRKAALGGLAVAATAMGSVAVGALTLGAVAVGSLRDRGARDSEAGDRPGGDEERAARIRAHRRSDGDAAARRGAGVSAPGERAGKGPVPRGRSATTASG